MADTNNPMGKDEQIAFIRELAETVTAPMIKAIEDGKVPEDWDGAELRQWLADKFAGVVWGHMRDHRDRQYQNYRRVVINENLI